MILDGEEIGKKKVDDMKSLIVTVAGTATRFNKDTEHPTLKCLYNEGDPHATLLYEILKKSYDIDEYIIVGGYLYEELKKYVEENLGEFSARIKLVYNPEYSTYGSGYSLIKGIEAVSKDSGSVVFVEGDLYFDNDSYEKVKQSQRAVFTVNHDLITSRKAVVVYETLKNEIRYLYDTSHKYLSIDESFLAVYNSGQVWKFTDIDKLRNIVSGLTPEQVKGTNLEIVQGYFGDLGERDYEMIDFKKWFNCNTVADYRCVLKELEK